MDQKTHEGEQTGIKSSHESNLPVADKSCPVSSTPVKKSQIHESQRPGSSPTPEKTNKESVELPEKFKYLLQLFELMIISLGKLNLNLDKKFHTFHDICREIEALPGESKFSHKILAQIKFILPDAVKIENIVVECKGTSSVVHDIKVALDFNAVGVEHSDYIALFHKFRTSLFELVKKHLEEFDVPEAEIPDLPVQGDTSEKKKWCAFCGLKGHSIRVCHSKPECKESGTSDVNMVNNEIADKVFLNNDEGGLLVGKTTSAGDPSAKDIDVKPSFKKRSSTKVVDDSAKTEVLQSSVLPSSYQN